MTSNTDLPSTNTEEENGREKPFSPVMTTGRIMVILVLAAVACPNHGEAKSRKSLENFGQTEFEEKPFYDFSNLVDAEWEEIEEKLGVVPLSEFKKMLKSLGSVATDSRVLRESGVRKGILSGELDDSQKDVFLNLARKYKLNNLPVIKDVLDDEKISPRNITFLKSQYSTMIRSFIDICDKYIKIREWMLVKGMIKSNDRKLNAFMALKKYLEKRLFGNGSGSTSNNPTFDLESIIFGKLNTTCDTENKTPLRTSFGRNDGKSVGRVRM